MRGLKRRESIQDDAEVQKIKTVVSAYFAERTAEVLTKVQDVLKTFGNGTQ